MLGLSQHVALEKHTGGPMISSLEVCVRTAPVQLAHELAAIGGRQQVHAQQHRRVLRSPGEHVSLPFTHPVAPAVCIGVHHARMMHMRHVTVHLSLAGAPAWARRTVKVQACR